MAGITRTQKNYFRPMLPELPAPLSEYELDCEKAHYDFQCILIRFGKIKIAM
jgi:hypothetical protein